MKEQHNSGDRRRLIRALTGPSLVLTLGILFAIDQAGGPGFSRTWPALLVVYGLFRLLEALASPASAPQDSAGN